MENPNLLYVLSLNEVNKGTVREVFMVNQLAYQHRVEYCTRSADYTIDRKYIIETGGKSKDGKQISGEQTAFIAADNRVGVCKIILTHPHRMDCYPLPMVRSG